MAHLLLLEVCTTDTNREWTTGLGVAYNADHLIKSESTRRRLPSKSQTAADPSSSIERERASPRSTRSRPGRSPPAPQTPQRFSRDHRSDRLALAASLAAMPDLGGNPRARFERDLLLVSHTAHSLARRVIEPIVVRIIVEGWSEPVPEI
jgi:hypothetical protein